MTREQQFLLRSLFGLKMVESYSDKVKVGSNDTTRDYLTFYWVEDEYLYNKLLNYHKGAIEEESPGYLKVLTDRDFGVARLPNKETYWKVERTELVLSLYNHIFPSYNYIEHQRLLEQPFGDTPLGKLNRIFDERYWLIGDEESFTDPEYKRKEVWVGCNSTVCDQLQHIPDKKFVAGAVHPVSNIEPYWYLRAIVLHDLYKQGLLR